MSWRVPVFAMFLAFIVGCSKDSSPIASGDDFSPKDEYYAAKPASHDAAMWRFQNALDDLEEILRDMKRYVSKGPKDDRHAKKVKDLAQHRKSALRRLDPAFKNVRNSDYARTEMKALLEHDKDVMTRLKARGYNLSFSLMISPCALPWIREYVCGGYYTF